MILNFSIENFGSIKSRQVLSFEADNSKHLEDQYIVDGPEGERILKLALIYGANASGKTTILRALDFLREIVLNPEEKKNEELDYEPFLFDDQSSKSNSYFSILFYHNNIKYFYEIEFNKKSIVKEKLDDYNPNKASVFRRETDEINQFSQITFGSKIKKDKSLKKALESNTLWNNSVLGGFLKTNIELKPLKEVTDWFEDYLHPMVSSNTTLKSFVVNNIEKSKIRKEDVVKILGRADFNISNLFVGNKEDMPDDVEKFFRALDFSEDDIEKFKKNPPRKIEFEHSIGNKHYRLPLDQQSQGTQRYFEFAGLLCLLIKQSIAIPIDELESSLHPDLYMHFILSFLINSSKSQILATTHNREILNNRDIFRNDAIWFTDKSDSCSTELYSLADFDTNVIRDTNNVLNAYKSGKLKGIPNLGDYFIDID